VIPLSVVIITNNEEINIERCIKSVLSVSTDIVVVDSGSKDATIAICRKYPVKVVERMWEGYALQKNFGNNLTINPYILSLDADEELTPELQLQLKALKEPYADVYEMPFKISFCGKWLTYTHWNSRKHVRIFRREFKWNNDDVHEKLIIPGNSKKIKLSGKINHYTIHSLKQYKYKNDCYAVLAAKKMKASGKKAGFVKLYISPAWRFFHSYILKLGFLEGYYGYVIAYETARCAFLKYYKLKNLVS